MLIVDDHPMFVDALKALLEQDARLRVVATAKDGAGALDAATSADADVALVDLSLGGMDGFETTRRLLDAHPDLTVIAISGLSEEGVADAALEAGASAFLFKGGLHDEIRSAILDAHDGG